MASRRTEIENALLYLNMAELSLQRAHASEGDLENLRFYRAILMAQVAAGIYEEPAPGSTREEKN